jgi:hydroxymethylpyrimidine/phosphomethylpyrimidine kinase
MPLPTPEAAPAVPPMVLTFAATDPTGGAGLQADLLTIAALDCHALSVVTALTVQDTSGVERMMPLESVDVRAQAKCVLDDVAVAAFKAGVIGSVQNARAVSEVVARYGARPFVVDPVLASGRGDPLAPSDMAEALRRFVFPLTTVLTPNSIEARRLAAPQTDLAACARQLTQDGCRFVLITGTHEAGAEVVNTLYDAGGVVSEQRWPRLAGSYHGSGCTLASAIAARLACGASVVRAVSEAQQFTWRALAEGFRPGRGQFLPRRRPRS